MVDPTAASPFPPEKDSLAALASTPLKFPKRDLSHSPDSNIGWVEVVTDSNLADLVRLDNYIGKVIGLSVYTEVMAQGAVIREQKHPWPSQATTIIRAPSRLEYQAQSKQYYISGIRTILDETFLAVSNATQISNPFFEASIPDSQDSVGKGLKVQYQLNGNYLINLRYVLSIYPLTPETFISADMEKKLDSILFHGNHGQSGFHNSEILKTTYREYLSATHKSSGKSSAFARQVRGNCGSPVLGWSAGDDSTEVAQAKALEVCGAPTTLAKPGHVDYEIISLDGKIITPFIPQPQEPWPNVGRLVPVSRISDSELEVVLDATIRPALTTDPDWKPRTGESVRIVGLRGEFLLVAKADN